MASLCVTGGAESAASPVDIEDVLASPDTTSDTHTRSARLGVRARMSKGQTIPVSAGGSSAASEADSRHSRVDTAEGLADDTEGDEEGWSLRALSPCLCLLVLALLVYLCAARSYRLLVLAEL